ncbi:MAG: S-methyl-5'-thioadenosine phosphorylase [Myxococcales bacterium]|nr:S-methyl-5'-thioadenosine phosphorylase [Myxococcales bacterium]
MSTPHPASPAARRAVVLGVIGGSGLYAIDGLENVREVELDTPFGRPSGPFTVGQLERRGLPPITVAFVPRHGPGHVLTPTEVNYRANIHGLKQLGATQVLSVSAVGSLRERIVPGHVVVPDQLIDRTKGREHSFFGGGLVAHIQFGDPMCPLMRTRVRDAALAEGASVHDGGSLVVMEGPAFSTRAESELYRSWGADIIGMTALPEAKLAREAELGYAILALATDYDCWRVGEEEVSVDAVLAVLKKNVALARAVVGRLARAMPATTEELPYPRALSGALSTDPAAIPKATRERLDLIAGHLL